jgi:hypothetical protein
MALLNWWYQLKGVQEFSKPQVKTSSRIWYLIGYRVRDNFPGGFSTIGPLSILCDVGNFDKISSACGWHEIQHVE